MSSGEIVLRVVLASLFGAVLGLERNAGGHAAGLRTHALVALGAAVFTLAGAVGFDGDVDAQDRIAAQVVSGIGFIGAGAIIQERGNILGLTTAASVWVAAALGVATGAGAILLAATGAGAALVLLLVSRVSKRWSREPVGVGAEPSDETESAG
jgi:putative Mg2+ transporter-C (MgtC) family protein